MTIFLRQLSIFFSLFLVFAVVMLSITFSTFEEIHWNDFFENTMYDVSYLYFVIALIFTISLISSLLTSFLWKAKTKKIINDLDEIYKSQNNFLLTNEKLPELIVIHTKIRDIDKKIKQQAELSQKLATERTIEREKSLQEVLVQERNRLARELHDSVSQQLFAASMMMATINEFKLPDDPGLKKQLLLVEKMIDQSQLEMRALLLHLRPVALKNRSLFEGIEELINELKEKIQLKIEAKIEKLQLDKGVEDHLFRILQESFSNTLRHAKATRIDVLLIEREGMIILRISDDGHGFDMEDVRGHGSYGLSNMEERAAEVGGQLKVISIPGQGTRIEVKVPTLRKESLEND